MKMGGLLGGLIAVALGVLFNIKAVFGFTFWGDFLTVLKGVIPPVLVFGGLFAIYIGITSLKDRAAEKKAAKEK